MCQFYSWYKFALINKDRSGLERRLGFCGCCCPLTFFQPSAALPSGGGCPLSVVSWTQSFAAGDSRLCPSVLSLLQKGVTQLIPTHKDLLGLGHKSLMEARSNSHFTQRLHFPSALSARVKFASYVQGGVPGDQIQF